MCLFNVAMQCPFLEVPENVESIKYSFSVNKLVAVVLCSHTGLNFTLECSEENIWHGNYSCETSQGEQKTSFVIFYKNPNGIKLSVVCDTSFVINFKFMDRE